MSCGDALSFRDLWAKTDRDDPAKWHPLANHLVEVAAVALEMWESVLAPASKKRWTDFCGGDADAAGRWLAFLAGVHDLGKCSPIFEAASKEQRARLERAGVRFPRHLRDRLPHGVITAGTLPALLQGQWPVFKSSGKVTRRYGAVSGMHHGWVFDSTTIGVGSMKTSPIAVGTSEWDEWRRDLFGYVLESVGDIADVPDRQVPYSLATWLAGVISVADWIGSNTDYFPFDDRVREPSEAFECARVRARKALDGLGLHHGALSIPPEFEKQFPAFEYGPNTTQRATIEAVSAMTGPGAVIVEAQMGDGKTEAAFWTAAHAQHFWGTRGAYIGMPTRASSDQLFDRFVRFLTGNRADAELVHARLVHGHAAISAWLDQIARGEAAPVDTGAEAPDEPQDPLVRADWFNGRGRALLAPYGTGTVDQTFLGVLETRHHFVRLAALAGKTLIFDEVHAYDSYMDALFQRDLEALGALGSPVVILTATLPRERTTALLQAYARGAGWELESDVALATYPRVSTVDESRDIQSTPIGESGRGKLVALRWFPGEESSSRDKMIAELEVALQGGGTCAIICNTVAQAQDMFRLLNSDGGFSGEVELFHARFRQKERTAIQKRVLCQFGKNPAKRPWRRIVVATQVIEQSLDLDFDLMISYFCPTDLLIQRVGRMHRHSANDGKRPARLREPQLWIIGVGDTEQEAYPVPGVPFVSSLIYDAHVLLRSWLALSEDGVGRTSLRLPDDIEFLIERTYNSDVPVPDDLRNVWERSRDEYEKRRNSDESRADDVLVPTLATDPDDGGRPIIRNVPVRTPEEEQKQEMHASAVAHTRLGAPSVNVIILKANEATSSWADQRHRNASLPMRAVAELLSRSVSISLRGVYHTVMKEGPPKAWERTTWLRRHRLLVLDDKGRAEIDGYTLELSNELGLVIEKDAAPPQEEE